MATQEDTSRWWDQPGAAAMGDFSTAEVLDRWPKVSDIALRLPKWHLITCIQLKVGCNGPDCNISGCREAEAGLAGRESPAAGLQPPGPRQLVSLRPDLPTHSPGHKHTSHGASPPGQDGDPAQPPRTVAGEQAQLLLSQDVGSLPTFSIPRLKNIPRSPGLAQLRGWSSSPSRDINSRR